MVVGFTLDFLMSAGRRGLDFRARTLTRVHTFMIASSLYRDLAKHVRYESKSMVDGGHVDISPILCVFYIS